MKAFADWLLNVGEGKLGAENNGEVEIETWKKRVFRKPGWFENLEFVLIDEEGHRIHAYVPIEFVNSFGNILAEFSYVHISNFDVHEQKCKTKYTNHMYKVDFNKNTRVKECSSFKVGYNHFHFVEFDKLLNYHVEDNTCIDLIGFLSGCYDIEDTEINGQPKMKLDCNVMDLNRNHLYCTLYEEHAWQLGTYVSDDDNYNNTSNVIIFQYARCKIWSDNISIHNGYHANRLFINSKLPEIEEFKHKLLIEDDEDIISLRISLSKENNYKCYTDDFLNMFPQISIQDVLGLHKRSARLINMIDQQLLEIQKHIGDINTFPQVFEKFVGRKFAFKVEISGYNIEGDRHVYNVLKMTDDYQVVPELYKSNKDYKVVQNPWSATSEIESSL
ncbi:replication protein A 70 kDa DNA-binding subunit D [Artemisia annua]|uniref:Replication protein A 70 kDa DNA-binding subunit D n=1 Tax=Artemisia annua TaxID=35608 RepID=A0A2U1PBF9_ARTAN|nr:replication protein A 70 kDa DNA-binding subunit D [Artemisia annua]